MDNSNNTGILDAGRVAIVNEQGISTVSPTALSFWTNTGGQATNPAIERMRIASNGNVGIGTSQPDAQLTVKGKIHAEEIKVDLNVPGPDYVFEKDYQLKSLEEVEKFVSVNKHLPEIPAASVMEKEGIGMGEMQMKLLQKIEELTLYSIEQNKKLAAQNKRVELLEKALEIILPLPPNY